MQFKKVTEERYDEMLGVLPPALWLSYGFLVGEAMDHNSNGQPTFSAFVNKGEDFFELAEPMTMAEFKALNVSEIT